MKTINKQKQKFLLDGFTLKVIPRHCFIILILIITFSSYAGELGDKVRERTSSLNELIEDKTNENMLTDSVNIVEDLELQPDAKTEKVASEPDENLITLNFKDADLRNLLRMIARSAGVNIIAGPEVKGTVTMELHKVNWEQALTLVLSVNGYTYLRDGNIIRVVSADQADKEPLAVKVVALNYAKADEIMKILKPMLTKERGQIQSDSRANVIIINDIPTKISQLEKVALRLDQPTPQVLIEVKFVEIGVNDTDTVGIDWSDFSDYGILMHDVFYNFDREITRSKTRDRASGTQSQIAQATRFFGQEDLTEMAYQFTPDDFRLAFSLLMNNGRAKLISNPKIQTLDNRKATIRVAETYYKPTFTYNKETGTYEVNNLEDIYVGITLDVTPHISINGYVTLDIVPTVSALVGNQIIQGVEVPVVNERTLDARVSLKDTYTVAIGGMVKDDWVTSRRSIPYFGDLPYIGKDLFGWNKKELQKNNLVIFITASIVKPENKLEERWRPQLREMHLTPNGEWQDVITNFPSWHLMAQDEHEPMLSAAAYVPLDSNELKRREENILISNATDTIVAMYMNNNLLDLD